MGVIVVRHRIVLRCWAVGEWIIIIIILEAACAILISLIFVGDSMV